MAKAIIKQNSGGGLYNAEIVYSRDLIDSEIKALPKKIEESRKAYLDASEETDALYNQYNITNRKVRTLKVTLNYYKDLLAESYKSGGETPPDDSAETAGGTLFNPPDPNNPPGGDNTDDGGSVIGGDSQSPPDISLDNSDVYNWYSDCSNVSKLDNSTGDIYFVDDAPNGEIYIDDNKLFNMVDSDETLEGKIFVNIEDGTKQVKFKTSRRNDFPLIDDAYFQTDDKWKMEYYYSITPSGTKTLEDGTRKVRFK